MSTWYSLKNFAKTTLSASMTAGATTATVADASKLPATTPYLITVWDRGSYPDPADDPNVEIMLVTGVASNNLTVTRGQEGTTASSHGSGLAVSNLLTAGTVKQITDAVDSSASPTFNGLTLTGQLSSNSTIEVANSGNTVSLVSTAGACYLSAINNDTGDWALRTRVGAEGNNRFQIESNGKVFWGPGNAAVDTNLYRNAADQLRTDDSLYVTKALGVGTTPPGVDGRIQASEDIYCSGVISTDGGTTKWDLAGYTGTSPGTAAGYVSVKIGTTDYWLLAKPKP
jgi:hypothetical protein